MCMRQKWHEKNFLRLLIWQHVHKVPDDSETTKLCVLWNKLLTWYLQLPDGFLVISLGAEPASIETSVWESDLLQPQGDMPLRYGVRHQLSSPSIGWHLHIVLIFPISVEVHHSIELLSEEPYLHGLCTCLRREEAGEHCVLPHHNLDGLVWSNHLPLACGRKHKR